MKSNKFITVQYIFSRFRHVKEYVETAASLENRSTQLIRSDTQLRDTQRALLLLVRTERSCTPSIPSIQLLCFFFKSTDANNNHVLYIYVN